MDRILRLKNPILDYAWGSKTAIADLLGQPSPSEGPQAEMWMGAHPKAPSSVFWNGRRVSLAELIDWHPGAVLGDGVVEKFGPRMPYLFKVLAAAAPLSIQAHPNRVQARQGFERENAAGIALDAPHRNYRDENHKPECLCALTPFWGLCGFRQIEDILDYFARLGVSGLDDELALLRCGDLKGFFEAAMRLEDDRRRRVTAEVRDLARSLEADDPVFRWIVSLHRSYPDDIGILAPILLNLVCLKPGQAMFLDSGQLHAYLEGTGIELMASSDNVLRGGLTPKHVDVSELMRVLRFEQGSVAVLAAQPDRERERRYPCAAEEFALSVIEVAERCPHRSQTDRSVEILLCTAGRLRAVEAAGRQTLLGKGAAVLVPAAVEAYRIEGSGTLYKASVPI